MLRDGTQERVAPRVLLVAAVAVHLALVTSLWTGWANPLFHDSDVQARGIDFYSIYQAGHALLDGKSIYVWDPFSEAVPYSAPFRYPPFVAYAIAAPLNVLPSDAAYWTWVVVIEFMLGLNAWLTFRLCQSRALGYAAASLWYVATPVYLEMYMGQWSLLMATVTFVAAYVFVRGRSGIATGAWAVSMSVKANSVLLLPAFLRTGAIVPVLVAGAIVVALNGPYFVVHPQDWREFWEVNTGGYYEEPGLRFLYQSGYHGLIGLTRTFWLQSNPGASATPTWLPLGVAGAVGAISLGATFLGRQRDPSLLIPLWISVHFLVYTAVWEHHYVMLLPALVLLIANRPDLRLAAAVVAVFVALPTPYVFIENFIAAEGSRDFVEELSWPGWASILYHAWKPVPVLFLWGTLCWTAMVEPRVEDEQQMVAPARAEAVT